MKKCLMLILAFTALVNGIFAQEQTLSLQNDGSSVVITVLAIIFMGFFVYLLMTERKITRLEKEVKERKK
jgi:CcmD family protein